MNEGPCGILECEGGECEGREGEVGWGSWVGGTASLEVGTHRQAAAMSFGGLTAPRIYSSTPCTY